MPFLFLSNIVACWGLLNMMKILLLHLVTDIRKNVISWRWRRWLSNLKAKYYNTMQCAYRNTCFTLAYQYVSMCQIVHSLWVCVDRICLHFKIAKNLTSAGVKLYSFPRCAGRGTTPCGTTPPSGPPWCCTPRTSTWTGPWSTWRAASPTTRLRY